MGELRLGDIIDDHCIKCRRLTNHAIVSMMDGQVAKVRCRSCYHDHTYLHEIAPPSKKDLKKAELFNAVLNQKSDGAAPDEEAAAVDAPDVETADASADEPEIAVASEPAEAPAKKTRGRVKKA